MGEASSAHHPAGEPRPARAYSIRRSQAGFFSSARALDLALGAHIESERPRGYYIDLRTKARAPHWPPSGLGPPGANLYVIVAQWGLGCHEHYVETGDEEWLCATRAAGDYLLETQELEGIHAGGWLHRFAFPHTYELEPPWLSGMAQGEGASLLVRLALATGSERYADAARVALKPLAVPVEEGGVAAQVPGGSLPEEYPTSPASLVLNGILFALWGLHDVGAGLDDGAARAGFEQKVDTLAANLHLWDTGHWSRYDLFPHPINNVASSGYHELHVNQLRAMMMLAPRSQFADAIERFSRYSQSRLERGRAFARKALFRLAVPRSERLNRCLPWTPGR